MSVAKSVVDGNKSDTAEGEYIIATIPTDISSTLVYYYSLNIDPYAYDLEATNANWTLRTLQPIAMVVCTKPSPLTGDIYYFKDAGLKSIPPDATRLFGSMKNDKPNN
jgi:hypothetical protein